MSSPRRDDSLQHRAVLTINSRQPDFSAAECGQRMRGTEMQLQSAFCGLPPRNTRPCRTLQTKYAAEYARSPADDKCRMEPASCHDPDPPKAQETNSGTGFPSAQERRLATARLRQRPITAGCRCGSREIQLLNPAYRRQSLRCSNPWTAKPGSGTGKSVDFSKKCKRLHYPV
jgi:hypothetical protein